MGQYYDPVSLYMEKTGKPENINPKVSDTLVRMYSRSRFMPGHHVRCYGELHKLHCTFPVCFKGFSRCRHSLIMLTWMTPIKEPTLTTMKALPRQPNPEYSTARAKKKEFQVRADVDVSADTSLAHARLLCHPSRAHVKK